MMNHASGFDITRQLRRVLRPAVVLTVGILLTGLLAGSGAGVAQAQAPTATWLDGPPRAFNTAGAAIPRSPASSGEIFPPCRTQERTAAGAEESQIAGAGWRLISSWPAQRTGNLTVVMATSDYDGMCRPMAFNGFAFADGRFAGTLAPAPMDSRADGVLSGLPQLLPNEGLAATFQRYAPTDPACCPSRPSARVTYRLGGAAGARVLVPVAIGAAPGLPNTGSGPTWTTLPATVAALLTVSGITFTTLKRWRPSATAGH